MKNYKVEIGYAARFEVEAQNKKEAEDYAWFSFDQSAPHEPEISIKEIKPKRERTKTIS